MTSEKVTVKQAVQRLSEANNNKNTPLPDLEDVWVGEGEGVNYIHITPTPSSRKFYNSTMKRIKRLMFYEYNRY
jgi:hypothetical protein